MGTHEVCWAMPHLNDANALLQHLVRARLATPAIVDAIVVNVDPVLVSRLDTSGHAMNRLQRLVLGLDQHEDPGPLHQLLKNVALHALSTPAEAPLAEAIDSLKPIPPTPEAALPTPDARQALVTLLASMFTVSELTQFVGLRYPAVSRDVAFQGPLSQVSYRVVEAFESRGLIDQGLWALLQEVRPQRAEEIARVQALWAGPSRDGRGGSGPTPGGGSWVDASPYVPSRPEALELEPRLVAHIPSRDEALRLAENAGVPLHAVDTTGPMQVVWRRLLTAAASGGKLRRLLEVIVEEPALAALRPDVQKHLD